MRNTIYKAILISMAAGSVQAFELPSVPGVPGLGGNKGGQAQQAESLDAAAVQEGVVQKYLLAATQVNQAQLHLAKAFELKDQVALLEAESVALQSGATDKAAFERTNTVSADAAAAINEKIASGAQLSEDGKKEYAASLLPFATGLFHTSKLPSELKNFGSAAQQSLSSASLMDKANLTRKLSAGMYLVTNGPSFISTVGNSTKQIFTYAQSNKIPMPKEATDLLGSL